MSRHLERADVLMQQSRYALAEEELRASLAEQEGNIGHCHALRGYCLFQLGKLDEADAAIRLALEARADEPFAHSLLALIADRHHNFGEARRAIDLALELDPTKPDYHRIRGHILFNEERLAEALAAADAGLALEPTDQGCSNLRALVLSTVGRDQEAAHAVDSALGRDPDDSETHATKGWTLLLQGNANAAREHFLEALRRNPGMDWARLGLLETMKAKLPLYAVFGRYPTRSLQQPGLLGLVLLALAVAVVACRDVPGLTFLLGMVSAVLVLSLIFASAFYTCLFSFVREGRRAMTMTECVASRIAIGCLTVALLIAACGYWMQTPVACCGALLILALTAQMFLWLGASPRS